MKKYCSIIQILVTIISISFLITVAFATSNSDYPKSEFVYPELIGSGYSQTHPNVMDLLFKNYESRLHLDSGPYVLCFKNGISENGTIRIYGGVSAPLFWVNGDNITRNDGPKG
ncbi:MAG: hypothetical protein LBD03_05675 [Methanobrevibacter sp.]|jgi:hypothetical protein|nr:hypothetical protein [Candidatus Methanovirga procula]